MKIECNVKSYLGLKCKVYNGGKSTQMLEKLRRCTEIAMILFIIAFFCPEMKFGMLLLLENVHAFLLDIKKTLEKRHFALP